MKKIELLSPAGGMKSLIAAVNAGADAVYIGGKSFSARMSAQNFDDIQMRKAIEFCHQRRVKTYVTVNTLVTDRELKTLAPFLENIYEYGADGVIVQDLGVAEMIKKYLPDLALHGSTQMTVHNLEGAKQLEDLGFKRVVLSRELSCKQIEEISNNTEIEIEVFAHGALCVCYSGQCLMSSMIGGRSGNRGKCAQPCRLQYDLDGEKGTILSLKDLSLLEHVDKLSRIGVDCIKLEGRMKGSEYISQITEDYRKVIDGYKPTQEDIRSLESVFYRGGYTDGYFTGKKDKSMYVYNKPENPYLKQEKYSMPPMKQAECEAKPRSRKAVKADKLSIKNRKKTELSVQAVKLHHIKTAYRYGITKIYAEPDLILDNSDNIDMTGIVCRMPRIGFDRDKAEKVKALGAEFACASNIGQIAPLKEMGYKVIGDYSLNIFNSHALAEYKRMGLYSSALSVELMLAQIRDIAKCMPVSVIAYGRIPLMHIENPPKGKLLIDRMGARFPIAGHEILNSCPVYMADKMKDIEESGVREARLMFTTEGEHETEKVIKSYLAGMPFDEEFTRGKFYKGV